MIYRFPSFALCVDVPSIQTLLVISISLSPANALYLEQLRHVVWLCRPQVLQLLVSFFWTAHVLLAVGLFALILRSVCVLINMFVIPFSYTF
jgi:hypothetical protein